MASDFLCSGACAIDAIGALLSPNVSHWHTVFGPFPVSQTLYVPPGTTRALRLTSVAEKQYLARNLSAETVRWQRHYRYFITLPDSNCALLQYAVGAGNIPQLFYRSATKDVVAQIASAKSATPFPVTSGKWYRFETLVNVSANPRTMAFRAAELDQASTDRGTASLAEAASTMSQVRLGNAVASLATFDSVIACYRTGTVAGDYPVGIGSVIPLQLVLDDVHSYNAANDFRKNNATDLGLAAVDTYLNLVGLLDNTALTDRITINAAAVNEYLAWKLGGMPAATSVAAMEFVAAMKGISTAAHKQTVRLMDGASFTDLWSDLNANVTSRVYPTKHITARPAGGALTQAAINAFVIRYASSFTAALVGGEIGGLRAEVEYIPSVAPPLPPGSPQQNPQHTYNAAGTYPVTLKVTDDDGLQASITKNVVVA